MACVGGELFCALGFIFLRGEAPLLSPLLWTRHSGVTVFPSARGSKNRYPAEGVSPRTWRERPSAHVGWSGYWFTTWRERSDWTRTSEAKIFRAREEPKIFASAYRSLLLWTRTRRNPKGAPQRSRRVEWLLVRVRGTYIAETPEACLWGFCYIGSPDWTRTSNPSINSRMLCQLSYGGLFCFRCWFPLQRIITIPGLFRLRNLKCREVHHSLGCVIRLRG